MKKAKKVEKVEKVEKVIGSHFPRNVYMSPGPIKTNNGKTYATVLVEDEDDLEVALEAGYIDSLYDALYPEENEEKETSSKEADEF